MSVDFDSFLGVPVDSFERPQPIPLGTYTMVVQSYEIGESDVKKTPRVRFLLAPVAPGGDVDASALPPGWQKRTLRHDFYAGGGAWRIRKFLDDIKVNYAGRALQDVLPETVGMTCQAYVIQAPSSKPGSTDIFNEISTTLPA